MNKNDWQDAGDQIKRLVQDAVDSGDFSRLGETIADVVGQTVNDVQWSLRKNIENAGQKRASSGDGRWGNGRSGQANAGGYSGASGRANAGGYSGASGRAEAGAYSRTNGGAANRIRREMEGRTKGRTAHATQQTGLAVPGEISGKLMKWTGYGLGGMFGIAALLVGGFVALAGAVPGAVESLLFWIVLCAGSLAVGRSGSGRVKLAQRFRRYMAILGNRTFCKIEELSSGIGQEGTFVRKDLRKMIQKGFFREGYLDRMETVLITDKNTYQQYLLAQEEYDRRSSAEKTARKARGKAAQQASGAQGDAAQQASRTQGEAAQQMAGTQGDTARQAAGTQGGAAGQETARAEMPSEVRELIEEGNRYIQYVHECNDRLPGKEISAKLDRLELVITRIFRETEKNPEIAGDLKKMMSYYLPTMKKLLDVYCDLEEQPVCGRNIAGTKKEIEDAIDSINAAFENLLDSFFEEKAWDVSSDISVLNTMFAQQGLKGKDFS